MHDMSNTRKEIAARLGFAAKQVFAADKRTTAGALRKALKAKGITSAADLEWHGISASDSDSTPYWLYEDGSMEKIKSSRPGAKTRMDRSDGNYFLISAMVDNAPTGERSFDTKAEAEYYGKQMLEATKQANPKAKSVKVSLMEVVNMSPQAPFKTLSSRLGAKVAFDNKQIAQGLSRLLKETGFDGMASDVLTGSSDSETLRKYVRVLKGKMSPLSGDAKSAELLSKLEKMLSSRSGEKETMAKWEVTPTKKNGVPIEEHTAKIGIDLWKIDTMPHAGVGVGSLYRWDKLRGLRLVSTGQVDLLKKQAEAISTKKDAISDLMRGFSRPGAKTRMTRDQTEEQKAGLKIMSAADPAVGEKIAKLIKEGKPQDQAVAIALDMKRRGEL